MSIDFTMSGAEIGGITDRGLIPDDLVKARLRSLEIIAKYQVKRIDWYESKITLKKVLEKDIAMFAARGVQTSDQYMEEAFRAAESSSEETMMGNCWQEILSAISEDTLDTGDLTTVRDGVLWVCEVKSQPNTVNSSSFPQELRSLRARMEELTRRRRASKQPVRAAYCILRDTRNGKRGFDEERIYKPAEFVNENVDLDGFEYRYISGKNFWKWLTGFDSEIALLVPLHDLGESGKKVKKARDVCIARLKEELNKKLDDAGLSNAIDDVVKYKDLDTI